MSKSVLRITCSFKCFLSKVPYDEWCDERSERRLSSSMGVHTFSRLIVVSNAVSLFATSPFINVEKRRLEIVKCNLIWTLRCSKATIQKSMPSRVGTMFSQRCHASHLCVCIGFANGTLRTHVTTGTVSGATIFHTIASRRTPR